MNSNPIIYLFGKCSGALFVLKPHSPPLVTTPLARKALKSPVLSPRAPWAGSRSHLQAQALAVSARQFPPPVAHSMTGRLLSHRQRCGDYGAWPPEERTPLPLELRPRRMLWMEPVTPSCWCTKVKTEANLGGVRVRRIQLLITWFDS